MNANCAPSEMTRRGPLSGAELADRFVNILSFLTTTVNGTGQSGRSEVFEDRERLFSQEIVNMLAKRVPISVARAQRLSETPELGYAVDHPGRNRLAECSCTSEAFGVIKGTTRVSLS